MNQVVNILIAILSTINSPLLEFWFRAVSQFVQLLPRSNVSYLFIKGGFISLYNGTASDGPSNQIYSYIRFN